jgi:hypothetical protein
MWLECRHVTNVRIGTVIEVDVDDYKISIVAVRNLNVFHRCCYTMLLKHVTKRKICYHHERIKNAK